MIEALPSVDTFLDRQYHRKTYNCWHLTDDVWFAATGQRLSDRIPKSLSDSSDPAGVTRAIYRSFEVLPKPISPCLAVMQSVGAVVHIGVYIRGRVLHITELGVEHARLQALRPRFRQIRFIR